MIVDWTTPRPVRYLTRMLQRAEELGAGTPESFLVGTPLDLATLNDPHQMITGMDEVQVIRNVSRALPQVQHLGLLAGQVHHALSDGVLGAAYATAPNLLSVVRITERFRPLVRRLSEASTLSVEGQSVTLTFETGSLPQDVRWYVMQREVSSSVAVTRELLGDPTVAVHAFLEQEAPTNPASMQAFLDLLGTPPTFGAERTGISVPLDLATRPLPRSSPVMHQQMLISCTEELAALQVQTTTTGAVMALVRENLPGASVESAAAHLAVSERTLRRQLSAEGTSFRVILDTIRTTEAERLLGNPEHTIKEISRRLGYDSAPAFTTAFRRWHNCSPSEFRKALTA